MSRALGLLGLSQLRLKHTLSFDQPCLLNVRESRDAWERLSIERNSPLREHQGCVGRVPVDLLEHPEQILDAPFCVTKSSRFGLAERVICDRHAANERRLQTPVQTSNHKPSANLPVTVRSLKPGPSPSGCGQGTAWGE
jgi:hypothetical protein